MDALVYKEYEIKAAPHQLEESGNWSLNIYITHHKGGESIERNFTAADTFKTRAEAISHCYNFGRKIIDCQISGCTVYDL